MAWLKGLICSYHPVKWSFKYCLTQFKANIQFNDVINACCTDKRRTKTPWGGLESFLKFPFCHVISCDLFSEQFFLVRNPLCTESAGLCFEILPCDIRADLCDVHGHVVPHLSRLPEPYVTWIMKLLTPRCFLRTKTRRAVWCTNAEKNTMKYRRVPRFRVFEDPTNWYSCLVATSTPMGWASHPTIPNHEALALLTRSRESRAFLRVFIVELAYEPWSGTKQSSVAALHTKPGGWKKRRTTKTKK